jgi:hypothetical protein
LVDAVVRHYTEQRRDVPDNHLLRRAALSAEFALAQYLVKGIAANDHDMISEAESMLATLAEDIAEHGGQPISVEPLPQPAAPPAPATPPAVPHDQAAGPGAVSPGLIPGPAATDVSEQMPAVHVTPIPTDENRPAIAVTPIMADSTDSTNEGDGQLSAEGQKDPDTQDGPDPQDGEAGQDGARDQDGGDEQDDSADTRTPRSADDTSTTALTVVDAKTP